MFCSSYKNHIEELEKNYKHSLQENEILKKEIQKLKEENEQLKQQLKTAQTNIEKLDIISDMIGYNQNNLEEIASNSNDNVTRIHNMVKNNKEVKSEIVGLKETFEKFMNEINNLINYAHDTKENVKHLEESVSKISDVINLIKDIADQTNLLALNAAIEAARAGEHGRGFAVVADEVRNLAEKTQKATTEVEVNINMLKQNSSSLIEGSSKVFEIIEMMEEFMDDFKESFNILYEIDLQNFKDFEELSNNLTAIVQKINNLLFKMKNYKEKLFGDSHYLADKGKNSFKNWYGGIGKEAFEDTKPYPIIPNPQKNMEKDIQKIMNGNMKNAFNDFAKVERETIKMYKMLDDMVEEENSKIN